MYPRKYTVEALFTFKLDGECFGFTTSQAIPHAGAVPFGPAHLMSEDFVVVFLRTNNNN